jgi:hypothetical protein
MASNNCGVRQQNHSKSQSHLPSKTNRSQQIPKKQKHQLISSQQNNYIQCTQTNIPKLLFSANRKQLSYLQRQKSIPPQNQSFKTQFIQPSKKKKKNFSTKKKKNSKKHPRLPPTTPTARPPLPHRHQAPTKHQTITPSNPTAPLKDPHCPKNHANPNNTT